MKIHKTIHRILFPSEASEIEDLQSNVTTTKEKLKKTKEERDKFKEKLKKPDYADLMRDNLGSLKIDFTAKSTDFLDGLPPEERDAKLALINDIYRNEGFHALCDFMINQQGNFTLKQAVNDTQIFAGRFNINGIMLLKKEVERCHLLHEERSKGEEEFNPHEIISSVN